MLPILLIHGYSSEGASNTPEEIYGTMPTDLRSRFGDAAVIDLNLSRWISLSDGVSLDDISFAMDRALKKNHANLFQNGFHVIIHSTGALVVRNWIRLFSPKPCPLQNLIHLAGANFGSGLAHIGRGQLARWGRKLKGTGRGVRVLDELEFGSSKTIDLHRHFLQSGSDMYEDYQVQEFCLIGSQTPKSLRHVPIRYVKEDSSDNTVRTSAGNLNFNYLSVMPTENARDITVADLRALLERRQEDRKLHLDAYSFDMSGAADSREAIPYSIAFETAHFGKGIGIVEGTKNRKAILPLIQVALETEYDKTEYAKTAAVFEKARQRTFAKAQNLRSTAFEWNKQKQYEGHAQLVFRLRDQFGAAVEDFDITLKSVNSTANPNKLEEMIEDKHVNRRSKGIINFYLRTQHYDSENEEWIELLDKAPTVYFEITAHEDDSDEIDFVPLSIRLTPSKIRALVQSFRTTIVDVTMLRLPSQKVFKVKKL